MRRFRLNPQVTAWLRAETPGAAEQGQAPDWDTWLLRRMSQGEIIEVGGVLVDRAVLHQRFACVSERCAPGATRGSFRSCCADLFVALTPREQQNLRRRDLLDWMKAREPRLASCQNRDFFRHAGEPGLAKPNRRCVFSRLDEKGALRCHLHNYARHAQVERARLQPVSCRLFPLIVVDRGQGRVALTVVARHTRRLVSAYPVNRYPCLADASLPPLHHSMRGDLDWLFGKGFAQALARNS